MVILHEAQRFQLGTFDYRAVVIQRVVEIESERGDWPKRAIKMHYDFPRLARGCAASYTEAKC